MTSFEHSLTSSTRGEESLRRWGNTIIGRAAYETGPPIPRLTRTEAQGAQFPRAESVDPAIALANDMLGRTAETAARDMQRLMEQSEGGI